MLNEKVCKKFTASNNDRAEKLLAQVLAEIRQMLEHSDISVYLGGSYGRGEGGVRSDSDNGLLYNDLDFFVFARKKSCKYDKLLQEIREKYEEILKVDVDFSQIITLQKVKQNSKRLMMQELKRGHVLVYGEDILDKFLAEIPAENLPFSEAARLLLNRGIGLLWANEKISNDSSNVDFILRNINKAVLGAGDALLISSGNYLWHIQERCEAIEKMNLPENWKNLYRKACEFKSFPTREVTDITQFWNNAKEFYIGALLQVIGAEKGDDLLEKIYDKCRESGELSIINYIKYCVKSRVISCDIKLLSMPQTAFLLPQVYAAFEQHDGKLDLNGNLYKNFLKFN